MRRVAALVAAMLAVLAAAPLPASADTGSDRIVLSLDRAAWATHLSEPLFDQSIRWVPGDTRTATFWVGNRAEDAGVLTVTGLRTAVDPAVAVSVRVAGGDWTPIGEQTSVDGGRVAAGADRRVDVRVTLDRTSGNQTQDRDFPVSFRASLVQADASDVNDAAAEDPADGVGSGSLAGTGADVSPALLLAALGALGTGGVLLIAGRRRNEQKEES